MAGEVTVKHAAPGIRVMNANDVVPTIEVVAIGQHLVRQRQGHSKDPAIRWGGSGTDPSA